MSKKEETSALKPSSQDQSQTKFSLSSKSKPATEDSNGSKKTRGDSAEDVFRSKEFRTEKSIVQDDLNPAEKYENLLRHLRIFYEDFKGYAMTEDIRDELTGVIKEDEEEDPLQVMQVMNYIVKLLMRKSQQERLSTKYSEDDKKNEYEEMLQKAENDIRQHIRIEQQLKLLIDNMQAKLDEYEKDQTMQSSSNKQAMKDIKNQNTKLQQTVKQKEQDVADTKKQVTERENTIRHLEEKLLETKILEHKFASLNEKHLKEKENMKNFYEQEYMTLSKEVQHIHRVLSLNLPGDDKVKLYHDELVSFKDFSAKKVQMLENRLKQFQETPTRHDKDDSDLVMLTDPGTDERGYSARPSTTAASVLKTRGYDLNSHRCSTETFTKTVESSTNRGPNSSRLYSGKKKNDIIRELKAIPVLGIRSRSKSNNRGEQPQQAVQKNQNQKEADNYFAYLKKRLENLQSGTSKEVNLDQLKSFDARRSSSQKRQNAQNPPKERSTERLTTKADISKQEEKSEFSSSDRLKHTKSVPKLRPSVNNASARLFKHIPN